MALQDERTKDSGCFAGPFPPSGSRQCEITESTAKELGLQTRSENQCIEQKHQQNHHSTLSLILERPLFKLSKLVVFFLKKTAVKFCMENWD